MSAPKSVAELMAAHPEGVLMALPPTVKGPIKDAFDALYTKLMAEWNAMLSNALKPVNLMIAWQYVVNAILQFTGLVDPAGIPKPDKAAAVLAYIKLLYENVYLPMLPLPVKAAFTFFEQPILNIIKGTIEAAVGLWHKVPVPTPPVPIPPATTATSGDAPSPFPVYN